VTGPHPLDRPVWNALHAGWADRSDRAGRALRLKPSFGPFAAIPDFSPDSVRDLSALVDAGEETWLVERDPPTALGDLAITRRAICVQMVAPSVDPTPPAFEIVALGEQDAAEMRALAELTKPGPFRSLTHRLGRFVGVQDAGWLVAMAGERMRLDGFVEVSGVCTHPSYRGRGYAGGLMRQVAARILAEGDTPFLHAYDDNAGALALYETLGFRRRATISLTVGTR
jgi:predicted GNAT family acetyltransferase